MTYYYHLILYRFRVFLFTDLYAPMSCICRPYFFKFAWVCKIRVCIIREYVHVPPPRNEWKRVTFQILYAVVSILALRVSLQHPSQRPCLRKYNHPSCLILCIYICTVKTVKNIYIYFITCLFICILIYLYVEKCLVVMFSWPWIHWYLCIYFFINHEFNIELHVYT